MDSAAAAPVPGTDQRCFGPFNTNVPIPYSITTLNEAAGYNPSLGKNHSTIAFLYSTFKPNVILCCLLHAPGVFTAPKSGVYSFSFTVYSYVQLGARIYHKVSVPKKLHILLRKCRITAEIPTCNFRRERKVSAQHCVCGVCSGSADEERHCGGQCVGKQSRRWRGQRHSGKKGKSGHKCHVGSPN